MKKVYKTPITMIVEVHPHHIMAGSEYINVNGKYDGTSTIESRRGRSPWDEDEDDDY